VAKPGRDRRRDRLDDDLDGAALHACGRAGTAYSAFIAGLASDARPFGSDRTPSS